MAAPPYTGRRTGLLYLLATAIGWGLNWPVLKLLLEQWPALLSRGIASIAATLLLAAIAAARGERLRVPPHAFPRLLVASLTNVFGWMGLTTLALKTLSAGQGALLVYTMPIWATLFAWPALGTRPTARSLAALGLGLAGVVVLLGRGGLSAEGGQWLGVALALGAAVSFALGTVMNRTPLPLPPISNVAWQVGLGAPAARHPHGGKTMPETPNLTPAEFLKYVRLVGDAKREVDRLSDELSSARGVYRSVLKAAKKAGINGPMMIRAMSIHTTEDEDLVAMDFRDLGRYLRYLNNPIGTQLGLFDDGWDKVEVPDDARKEHEEWEAHDHGYRAAQDGIPIDQNPNPPGSEVAQVWALGWKEGKRVVNDVLAGNPAKSEPRRGRKAKADDAIVAGAPA